MGHRLNGVTGKGGITGQRGFKGGIKGERHGPSVPSAASFVQRQQFGREHLGGALGAALASHFTQQGWITREKHSRVMQVTTEGATCLKRLGLKLSG